MVCPGLLPEPPSVELPLDDSFLEDSNISETELRILLEYSKLK